MALPIRAIEVARTVHDTSPQTLEFPEAALQTFKKGAFVVFNAAGNIIEATDDASLTQIVGIAAEDGANDPIAANSRTTVWIADDDTIFVASLTNTGVITPTAQNLIGQNFGVVRQLVAPFNWSVDTNLAVHLRRVVIVDLDSRDFPIGTPGGRVLFMVAGFFRKLAATS